MKRRVVLYIALVLSLTVAAQRRFSTAERWEYKLEQLADFTSKDVNNATDFRCGLHRSQYAGTHFLYGFSLEGSWSSFVNNMPQAHILPGGGSVGAHLLFEVQYSGILFQTGVGLNFQQVRTNVMDTSIYHEHMHDTWEGVNDVEFLLKHDFYHRQDLSRQLYLQIPLYVGHYIIGAYGVGYFLAGFHLNWGFKGSTQVNLEGSSMGFYEKYLGVWREMDNHGFRKDVPVERRHEKLNLKCDIMGHAEIGYEYTTYNGPHNYRKTPGNRIDARLRVAAFFDMGIINICPGTDYPMYSLPMETIYDFPTYDMYHVFATEDAKHAWVRNLFVGLRFTVLIAHPGSEKCILCDPWKH